MHNASGHATHAIGPDSSPERVKEHRQDDRPGGDTHRDHYPVDHRPPRSRYRRARSTDRRHGPSRHAGAVTPQHWTDPKSCLNGDARRWCACVAPNPRAPALDYYERACRIRSLGSGGTYNRGTINTTMTPTSTRTARPGSQRPDRSGTWLLHRLFGCRRVCCAPDETCNALHTNLATWIARACALPGTGAGSARDDACVALAMKRMIRNDGDHVRRLE
jgi:hypothetical protein